ncbi:NineTeen Complex (NTC) component [Cladochytrium tenue]|nr:NineTeen Complex (NTC) component [Cladochytrium tenue]
MLYRFREAQMAELGIGRGAQHQRRPGSVAAVDTVREADRWRSDVIREISRKVAKIQDSTLSEFEVRDLNDKINKLLRDKRAWEYRIKELGGPDYRRSAPRMLDQDGKEIPGSQGYKYFGRAKDLPGVRELFEVPVVEDVQKTRGELLRAVGADYYGYRDEDDGLLLQYEKELEKRELARAKEEDRQAGLHVEEDDAMGDSPEDTFMDSDDEVMNREYRYASVVVPSVQEVEQFLVQKRKQEILDRFLGR